MTTRFRHCFQQVTPQLRGQLPQQRAIQVSQIGGAVDGLQQRERWRSWERCGHGFLWGHWTVIKRSFSTKTQFFANIQLGEALKMGSRLAVDHHISQGAQSLRVGQIRAVQRSQRLGQQFLGERSRAGQP